MTEENLGGEAGLIEERKKKLKLLRESNKAYVNDFDRTHRAEAIIAEYQDFSKAELEEKNIDGINLAGRIVLKRVMGNASFITIRDELSELMSAKTILAMMIMHQRYLSKLSGLAQPSGLFQFLFLLYESRL